MPHVNDGNVKDSEKFGLPVPLYTLLLTVLYIFFVHQYHWKIINLVLLNTVHLECDSFSVSAVNIGEGILKGRLLGGVKSLWKKFIACKTKIVTFDDRLLG